MAEEELNTTMPAAPEAAPAPDVPAEPEKKRRGRPRKNPLPEADGAAPAPAADAEVEKPKRRGRPRKVTTEEAPQAEGAAAETAPAAEAEKPKRRGRPRKVDVEAAAAASAAEAHAPVQEAAPEAAAAGVPEPEKKRRGRPRKVVSDAADAPSKERDAKSADSRPDQQGEGRQGKQQDAYQDNNRRRNRRDKFQRQRNNNNRNRNQVVEPKTNKDELAAMKVAELREKAAELDMDVKGMLKADLVEALFQELVKREGFREVEGILDILPDGYGFVRTKGYLPGEGDAYVNQSMIRRNHLRKGDWIAGQMRPARENEKFGAVQRLDTVNGKSPEELGNRVKFADLTPVFPDERLTMEHGKSQLTARVIDLTAPIGKGQRGLIVSPPKAGKTTVLKDIAAAISANNPEVHLMCLLVDERPEEVTDMERSIKGEVIASTFDMPSENHIAVAELVIERAKRMVEDGRDVVILLDSITRLARAYNLAQPASGRVLSGGVDSTALYPPKRFLGAARNIEHGGSLTILASALIDTGSKMDEVIFEEFKGTGNMELKLDRNLADRRIFPAIDPVSSGTRKEELLMDPQEAPLIWAVRRILANLNNTERAMNMLIKSLRQTDNNTEFLLRTAKKMQGRAASDIVEF